MNVCGVRSAAEPFPSYRRIDTKKVNDSQAESYDIDSGPSSGLSHRGTHWALRPLQRLTFVKSPAERA